MATGDPQVSTGFSVLDTPGNPKVNAAGNPLVMGASGLCACCPGSLTVTYTVTEQITQGYDDTGACETPAGGAVIGPNIACTQFGDSCSWFSSDTYGVEFSLVIQWDPAACQWSISAVFAGTMLATDCGWIKTTTGGTAVGTYVATNACVLPATIHVT